MSERIDDQSDADPPVGTPDSEVSAPTGVAESVNDIEMVSLDDPQHDDRNGPASDS